MVTLVSIIIPVYNTKPFLDRCLKSILNQTLKNIEIICVDDGSTDGSGEWLDEISAIDRRIKVIHKKNGGLVTARKVGANIAEGEFVGYVDSDDWIEPNMYEKLYQIAYESRAELVTCGYYLDGNYTTIHLDNVEEGMYDNVNITAIRNNTIYCLPKKETGLRGSLCCKLFRRDKLLIAQNKIPDSISIAEDKLCLLQYILDCESVYVLRDPLYHWVVRQDSMSHEDKYTYLSKVHEVYVHLTTMYAHNNFTEIMRAQAEIYIIELLFLGINKRMGFKNKNLIWIDPMWLDMLPVNASIILYGGGELGEKYSKQLLASRPDLKIIACVDEQYKKLSKEEFKVLPIGNIKDFIFDYIVITIKNRGKAMQIKEKILSYGIADEKVLWREQPEAYWKYIEAEGLLLNKV